tara:strand:+ start:419 stop:787 length:369 start_codon:yes stop_codon:yes gene_type:complete
MKLDFWIKGGTTLKEGTSYSGAINGYGSGSKGELYIVSESAAYPNNAFYVAGVNDGRYVEFSGSRSQVETNIKTLTGLNPHIPSASGHGGRVFYSGATDVMHSDYPGVSGHIHNPVSASYFD